MKFKCLNQVLKFLLQSDCPTAVIKEMLFSAFTVEKVKALSSGQVEACLLVAQTDEQARALESENGLNSLCPEQDLYIKDSGELWRKRVYVVDDAGGGYVLFERLCNADKNGG